MGLKQKVLTVGGIGIILLYLAARFILPIITDVSVQSSPIASITATNDRIYRRDTTIREKDFEVEALHENGRTSKLNEDEYELSVHEPALIGDATTVKISLKTDEKISCIVNVKNHREAVMKFYCGKEKLENVTAVLYSNGELSFEGEGNVLSFNDYPWKEYEDMDETPITAVTFQKTVTPKSMDEWFSGIDTLVYVGEIPNSVESMEKTFENCTSLEEGPDWSKCDSLINTRECFKDCESLTEIVDLPQNVIVAANMCDGCTSLTDTSDLSKAAKLLDASAMYQDCTNLIYVSIPLNVQDISYMFAGCINLENMPVIPDSVTNMEGCFEENQSLHTLTNIPEKVENVSSCFAKCGKIEGTLIFDANPTNYSNLFSEAVVATTVSIQGKSEVIDQIIEDAGNINISR